MKGKYPFKTSFLALLVAGFLLLIPGEAISQAEKALQSGDTSLENARYDSALIYYNRALAATKDSTVTANAHYGSGKVYSLTSKFKEATTSYQKAFIYYQKTKNNEGAVNALLGLGYSSFKTKKYPQARDFYNQALERAQKAKAFEQMVEAYDGLANVYEAQKDFKRAISAVRFMQGAYDSIMIRDHKKQVKQLDDRYSKMVLEKDSLLVIAEAQHSQVKTDRLLRLIERDDIRLTFYSVALGLTFVLICFFAAWLISRQNAKNAESRLRKEQANIKLSNEHFEIIAQQVNDELTKGLSARNMMDIMWLLNPNNKSLESLIIYMREQFNALLKGSGVKYMIVVPDKTPNVNLTSLERVNLYVVTRDLINDAVNCSKTTGLTLSITIEGWQMIFTVKGGSQMDEVKMKPYREKMEQVNGTFGAIHDQAIYRLDLPKPGQA